MVRRPPLLVGIATATVLIVLATLLIYPISRASPPESLGVIYLLGVALVAAEWGFRLGAVTAVVSAVVFDYFHLRPVGTIGIYQAGQGLVIPVFLVVFLVVALLVSTLANWARLWAVRADERRREAETGATRAQFLADEQGALRRVAELTGRDAPPDAVFAAVARELGHLLSARFIGLGRAEPDAMMSLVGSWTDGAPVGDAANGHPAGAMGTLAESVWRTGRFGRLDPVEDARGTAPLPWDRAVTCAVCCPIVVNGQVWGVIMSLFSTAPPEGTEVRMTEFTALLATSIANSDSQIQLATARAQVSSAAGEARERIERDLHDGLKPDLIALGIQLHAVRKGAVKPQRLDAYLAEIDRQLAHLIADLRGIVRGAGPARFRGGLEPALRELAERSSVEVDLDVHIGERLPENIEAAVCYIVSEALANVTVHARARTVRVRLRVSGATVLLSIRDDGIGGAVPRPDSGLSGLRDRTARLGGHFEITSFPGRGTSLLATIPLEGGD